MAKFTVRLRAIQVVFGAGMVVLLARAAQVQLVQGARHAVTSRAQRTERIALPARRGSLYDRNGVTLALTQEVFHVGVAPNELRNPEEDVRTIAAQLGWTPHALQRELTRRYAYFHGPFTSSQVLQLKSIRGVHLTSELVRFYPDPLFARPLLGRPAADGRPASGLERVLDSILTGTDGSAVVLRDRQGRRYESPSRLDAFPTPGHDVYLTLDAELQEIIEHALRDAVERYEALSGDVVVVNPTTGEILALASHVAQGRSEASALTNVFEPGSTAKLFAASAILVREIARPGDSVWVEQGTHRIGSRTIRDEHPSEWLTLQEVVEQSSNIGMVKFIERLSAEAQYAMLRDFGLGSPTGVEYPSESAGILKRPHQWSGTTPASLAIGYEVAVTALQLAQAYAAVANNGVLLQPTLVREIRSLAGKVIYRHVPEPIRRVISPQIAGELRAMLRGVVYHGGTGSTAALTSYEVAGKTGTALRAGTRGYVPGSYTATFVSLFPADDPQLTMVVKLDDPKDAYSRLTAAPVTRAVLEQLLATRSGALDRGRLTVTPRTDPPIGPALDDGAVPYVVAWPVPEESEVLALRPVPDVAGLSLRQAARALHRAGLRVRIRGWGRVIRSDPAPGVPVAPGTMILLEAAEWSSRR